jgi:YD repeat-containing protein
MTGNGNLTESIDGDNRTSYPYFDKDNRLVETIDPDRNTTFKYYDGNGNLTESIDADGNKTYSYYDPAGQRHRDGRRQQQSELHLLRRPV